MDETETNENANLKLSSIIKEIELKLEEADYKINEEKEMAKCLILKLKSINNEVEDVKGTIEKYYTDLNNTEQEVAVIENDINNLKINNNQIEKEILSIKEEIQRKQEDEKTTTPDTIIYHAKFPRGALLVDIINELTENIEDCKDRLCLNNTKIKNNDRKLSDLNWMKMEYDATITELQYMLDKLSKVHTQLDQEVKELHTRITQTEICKSNLFQHFTKCKSLICKDTITSLDNEINEIRTQYKSLQIN